MAESQLSDFQKKKILGVFNTLYDTNKDGVIELCDFEEAINTISKVHKWPIEGDKYKDARKTMSEVWEGLRGFADVDHDERITKDEWLKMWSSCVGDLMNPEKGFPEWQKNYMEFMFDVNDTSCDGYIDKNEYTTIYTAFGIDKASCEKSFDRLAEGTDGNKISQDKFKELWKEYFLSKDREARGNYLFGQPPC